MAYGVYRLRGIVLLAIRDFILALAVFWGVALGAAHGPAHAFGLPGAASACVVSQATTVALPPTEMAGQYEMAAQGALQAFAAAQNLARPTVLLLSIVFAMLTMLNLAFFRHLNRVYAKPKPVRARRNSLN